MKEVSDRLFEELLSEHNKHKNKKFNQKIIMEDWHHVIVDSIEFEPDDAKTIDEIEKFIVYKSVDMNLEVEHSRETKKGS